jgi:RNA polymerase sigma factor (sigma-70 family)
MYEAAPPRGAGDAAMTPPLSIDAIVAEHGAAIARVAAAFEANPARRDELGQEILLAIWQSLPRFRGDATLKTFVLRIAHNRAVDHALQASRDLARDDVLEDLPDPKRGPEYSASLQQRGERLAGIVRRLPLAQRQLVTLALEGLSHEEIGGMLGISVGNVAVRLNRARKHITQQMGESR